MNPQSRVAAIVVNFNAGDHLVGCVRSLRDAAVDQIVVADNASVDGSIAELRRTDPAAVVIETGGNYGYGGGVNRGAAAVAGNVDVLLVCNADLIVEPAAVKTLVDALDADAGLGIVGPRIDNSDGTLYPSARMFPHLFGRDRPRLPWPCDAGKPVHPSVPVARLGPQDRPPRRLGLGRLLRYPARRLRPPRRIRRGLLHVSGGRRSLPAGVGPRRRCRLRTRCARVVHIQGVSADQLPYRMLAAHHRSILRWWWSSNRWPGRALAPLVALGLGVRFALALAVRTIRPRRRARA